MKKCRSAFVESAVLRIHDTNMRACCVRVIVLAHFVLPRLVLRSPHPNHANCIQIIKYTEEVDTTVVSLSYYYR